MKIFYLITKSEAGGAQTHVFQLARHFTQRGHQIAVMAFPGGWLEKEITQLPGASFYPNVFFSNSLNPLGGHRAMALIKEAVSDFNPDLVSCHSSAAGFWGRLALLNKYYVIFTAHGWGFAQGVPTWRRWLMIITEKIASHFCRRIICVSANDGRLARKYRIAPAEKISVIHNGVEDQDIDWLNRTYSYPLQLVFVGRLAAPKEPLRLLRAISELPSNTLERFGLIIIGDGPDRSGVEKFIVEHRLDNQVRMVGYQDRSAVLETLKLCHIFVLLSRWEGFPRSVLEAMSCGLAIIASDVGAVREAVDSDCGRLIRNSDIRSLKQSLIDLVNQPDLVKKMGQAAQKKVKKYFSLERMLTETEKAYLAIRDTAE